MAIALPPSIHADYLVLRRAGWIAMARTVVAPALLVLGCVILICASLYRGLGWCVPLSAMLALAGSFALTCSRLMGILVRSRFGWCGALPVRAGATAMALLALTATALAVAVLFASLLLWIAAVPAPHPDTLGLALLAVDGGLSVGTAAAVLTVFRKGAVAQSHHTEGIREPLFALPWLNDARLPHLLDWQRRAALVKWRRGGSALVAVVLVAVPDSASIPMVAGLVLLVLSLVWLDVVMRACAAVTIDAVGLLGAMPVMTGRMRRSSLRYPLVAAICAVVLAVIGAILMGRDLAGVLTWCACAIAASAWSLRGVLHTTNSGSSR